MKRVAAVFLVIGLGASACGADPAELTAGSGSSSEDQPLVERTTDGAVASTVPPSTVAPLNTEAPSTSAPPAYVPLDDSPECAALAGTLVGPERVIDEQDDAIIRDVLVEVLGPIDPVAGEAIVELFELAERGDVDLDLSDKLVKLVGVVDDVTYAACGLPVLSASGAVEGGAVQRFCEVSAGIDGAEPPVDGFQAPTIVEDPCPPLEATFADTLPCFRSTGAPLSLFEPLSHQAVDCDSGEPVEWDPYGAQWQPAVDRFEEIDQAIG